MKRKGGLLLILGGLLLLAAAGGLGAYNVWDADRAGVASEAALETLDQRIPVLEELDLPEELIPDHILNPQMDMPPRRWTNTSISDALISRSWSSPCRSWSPGAIRS